MFGCLAYEKPNYGPKSKLNSRAQKQNLLECDADSTAFSGEKQTTDTFTEQGKLLLKKIPCST